MDLFAKDGRNIFVVNNEYVNRSIIFGNRETGLPETDDDVLKGKMGHGVTAMEVKRGEKGWQVVKGSKYNRRITPDTPIAITGPAKGHDLLKTSLDADGIMAQGTWNNCGNGRTPWGTYLACEENFNGYFSASDASFEQTPEQKRYGLSNEDWGYAWAKIDDRFDMSKEPNECHRAGYVVEIDPFNPNSTPKKRTALGRFKHENAEVVIASNGQIVVYMGDDERGEFIYKYVSDGKFSSAGDNSKLLDEGKLYAAKFNDDLTGEWLELSPETTGMSSQAEICIYTRQAGSKVGATTMDRPEWVASNPNKPDMMMIRLVQQISLQPICLTHRMVFRLIVMVFFGYRQTVSILTESGEIRRFLVGPNECEVTGATWSADGRTMFVGIQHPGEKGKSNWPDGGTSVPKSAIIAIEREDGGIIG